MGALTGVEDADAVGAGTDVDATGRTAAADGGALFRSWVSEDVDAGADAAGCGAT